MAAQANAKGIHPCTTLTIVAPAATLLGAAVYGVHGLSSETWIDVATIWLFAAGACDRTGIVFRLAQLTML